MNKNIFFRGFLLFTLLLMMAACRSNKKTPLNGTWVFEKNELFPGVTTNAYQDSMLHILQEQQQGLTLVFSGNNFRVSQLKNGHEEKLGNQPFELSKDQHSLILKNKGRADDVFPIVKLSGDTLKLNMFNSDGGYLVFLKKK